MKLSEELREHFYSMSKSVSAEDDLIEKVEALEQQIEKMKCCENCSKSFNRNYRISCCLSVRDEYDCFNNNLNRWKMAEVNNE